jgi:hypothetical protein
VGLAEPGRQKKITFAEMRAADVRGLLIYYSDYKCHRTTIGGDGWPDDVRLSDLEPLFTCQVVAREEPMSAAGKKRPEAFPGSRIRIWSQAQDRTSEGGRTFRGKKCNH